MPLYGQKGDDIVDKDVLIEQIGRRIYPTSQIMRGELTIEEYVVKLAEFFAKEVFNRRMDIDSLPLLAKLACVLHNNGEIEY